ncbi:acyl-CoA-binding domain-containing protein 3-like [Humulus lupulus]|uniref:acyl-CoA-binding domain-containing protein 3-like n=1 Tax=Humulus lupulus TaxID=3486 RepID=UPI002B4004E4|nr:acyl-CoA-binding domain-containing protein 3-like [Humulus lupulus]
MELVGELFLTATVVLFLSFIVAKLVTMAMKGNASAGRGSDLKSTTIADEDGFEAEEVGCGESKVQGFGSEKRVRFVEEAFEKKVDRLEEVGNAVRKNCEEELELEERSETVQLPGTIVSEGEETTLLEKVRELDVQGVNIGCAGDSREESLENEGVDDEIGVESGANDVVAFSTGPDEVGVVVGELKGDDEADEVVLRNIGADDDDWEGIDRNELENDFTAAVKFVESGAEDGDGRLAKVASDVQMELYGLRRVAMKGPCHESQPLAPNLTAQAKWNSWQRLGTMSQEMAMEQYITILSNKVPGWMEDHSAGEDKEDSLKEEMPDTFAAGSSTLLFPPQCSTNEREPEVKTGAGTERVEFTAASDLENRGTG